MTEHCINNREKPTDIFNPLAFERKVVELVEELRLRRNLEIEGETTLKSVMEEKYQEELSWEKQQRRHIREKEELEQQIGLLKRKLEDKVCVSDEDKAKQQVMNRTYSHEIRMLKEELRVSKSEKLNLQKKIQELEGKLNLHNSFQESIMNQMSDARKMMKSILEESQQLATLQKNVMENVASAKTMFKKYDLCNQHLQQAMTIVGKKSEALKKELISSRSEITILKQSMPTKHGTCNSDIEVKELQKKVLNLENLLLLSRKENEKTLNNFLESNKLLCQFMDKYSAIKEHEKQLTSQLELLQEELNKAKKELQATCGNMKETEAALQKEKERIESHCSVEVQTESNFSECQLCFKENTGTIASKSLVVEEIHEEVGNVSAKLKKNFTESPEIRISPKSGIQDFSMDQLFVSSGNMKMTINEVLKRKLEVMESGTKIELISMKRSFTENIPHLGLCNEKKGSVKSEIQASGDTSYVALSSDCASDTANLGLKSLEYLESPEEFEEHNDNSKHTDKELKNN